MSLFARQPLAQKTSAGRSARPDTGQVAQAVGRSRADLALQQTSQSLAEILDAQAQPLESAARSVMESRFGHDFSRVRVHTDARAAAAAASLNALAFTVGNDVVFAAGRYAPHSPLGHELLAHELTHVVQQRRGGPAPQLDPDAAHERGAAQVAAAVVAGQTPVAIPGATGVGIARQTPDPRHARGFAGEQGMGFELYPRREGWIFFEGPSGAAGHGVTRPGFDGVAYNTRTDQLHLIDNKSLASSGNVRSATAIDPSRNLGQNLDGLIERVAAARDVPGRIRVLQLLRQARAALTAQQPLPGNVRLVVTGVGGQSTGVSPRLAGQGVEFRPATPPGTAPPVETPPAAAPAPPAAEAPAPAPPSRTAPPAETPPAESSPAARPGRLSGLGSGLLSVGIPLVLGWIHQRAVGRRVQEQASREGYVPRDAPSGLGLLYDIGAWLIDPARSAEAAVGIDQRFNLGVWRARIRASANQRQPGERFQMRWDIGLCRRDIFGRQEVEERTVVYRKQSGGRWSVESGDASGTPDLNDIISTDVPDDTLRAIIMRDPCLA